MTFLVAAFAVQTALVYSDDPTGPIDEAARRGRQLWHDNGCQVCHQFYGQGGFLGPDLTNAYSSVDTARLHSVLTIGSGQMPAFGFTDEQIQDIRAFLRAMDRPDLGRGQLRLAAVDSTATPWARFEAVARPLLAAAPDAARGWDAIGTRICSACHQPLAGSAVGAPDLSRATDRLSEAELRAVLTDGRPAGGMPPPAPAFTPEELDAVIAFLTWMGEQRDALEEGMAAAEPDRSVRWSDLPWWEYR